MSLSEINDYRRRNRMLAGVAALISALALNTALFITPLERRFLSGESWFLIVSALYAVSAVLFFVTWKMNADRLGVAALSLAILTSLILAGFIFVFLMTLALSGLR